MDCSDSDDYNSRDGCAVELASNTEAHNECLEDNEGCDPGDYCMFYPDLDLGWLYGMPLGTITADSYQCVAYETCFPIGDASSCDSDQELVACSHYRG